MGDIFAENGDLGVSAEIKQTAAELLPAFYEEVRQVARRERRRVGAGETMRTTALIHEAYLRLHKAGRFNDHSHFLRSAALAMRHSLINYARERVASKRGAGAALVPLEEAGELLAPSDQDLVEVNDALNRLTKLNPRLAQVVECRFFAGYGDEETAQALGLTDRTVRRDWIKARAWLLRELGQTSAKAL